MLSSGGTAGMSAEDEQKSQSFTASLVSKIVDNLQIEVRASLCRGWSELGS